MIPSLLWWHSTAVLSWFPLLFVVIYLWLYTRLVRFKTPRWLIFRRHGPTSMPAFTAGR